jgi:hypothetical protein
MRSKMDIDVLKQDQDVGTLMGYIFGQAAAG